MPNRRLWGLLVCMSLASIVVAAAGERSSIPATMAVMLDEPPIVDDEIGSSEWAHATVIDEPFIQVEPE